MLSKPVNSIQLSFLQPGLKEQLSNKHPLYILADQISWQLFEESFRKHYREDFGRPAKPIRLMVALILLKHIRNLSDESVVEQWSENGYYQYFSGGQAFTPAAPCEASELVHFRNRIGSQGIELILNEGSSMELVNFYVFHDMTRAALQRDPGVVPRCHRSKFVAFIWQLTFRIIIMQHL